MRSSALPMLLFPIHLISSRIDARTPHAFEHPVFVARAIIRLGRRYHRHAAFWARRPF
jgi:hypothetical protein